MEIRCETAVIGTGMAGLAAALFAARQGLTTTVIGSASQTAFASGLIDVLGVHPPGSRRIRKHPWTALQALARDDPEHPYAKMPAAAVVKSLDTFFGFLQAAGLSYRRRADRNCIVLTAAGTLKPTYAVPASMWNGVAAWEQKAPCLIVGIHGLKGFSARLIAENLRSDWPALRPTQVSFPEAAPGAELFAERIARRLEFVRIREAFAAAVSSHLTEVKAVGMPAVLGLYRTAEVFSDLQARIGVPVFEIPTMPPSVPGMRIKEAFMSRLPQMGVRVIAEKKVLSVEHHPGKGFSLAVGSEKTEATVVSRAVILATGRFLGGGLRAERKRISETVFDLPVVQPADRNSWHRGALFDERGHLINRAGVAVDDCFRPTTGAGRPAFDHLFAAGTILAHQDWMREKCGTGLSVASAYAAVSACRKMLRSDIAKAAP